MVWLRMPPEYSTSVGRVANRWASLLVGLAATIIAGVVVADTPQTFPYVAYVLEANAYARSGPGQRYYPTAKLPPGLAVEVYRHDGSGWCAVRPPEESFSWIPAHQVRLVGARAAEVVAERAVARVGSSISPARSAVQVMLPRGERVEVLAPEANDDVRWLRIVAPAGEFRWVAASHLSRQPPLEVSPPARPSTGWARAGQSAAGRQPTAFDHLDGESTGPGFRPPPNLAVESPVAIPHQGAIQDSDAIDVVAGSPAELQLTQFGGRGAPIPPPPLLGVEISEATALPIPTGAAQEVNTAESTSPRVRLPGLTAALAPQVQSVEELEVQLSQTVVGPPEHWQLDQLETEADRLLAETRSPAIRAQLREFKQRVARFQQVGQRYTELPPVDLAIREIEQPTETDPFTGQTVSVRQRVQEDLRGAQPSRSAQTDKPLYDAVGRLKPVVSKREKAPQFALVDEQGDVVSFVTPTPDLDLQPYIGHRIGVHGNRGYMPEFRRAHVTAGRVTPIDRAIRR